MKEERLLDAFGQINEKFIEEADPEKKRESNRSKSKNISTWIKWGAMAACAVVVVGITIPALNRDKGWTEGANEAGLENNITEGKPETEEGEVEEGSPGIVDDWDVDLKEAATMEYMTEVQIRIDEIQEHSFVGTVVVGTDEFKVGEVFTVQLQDNVTLVDPDGEVSSLEHPKLESSGYKVGDTVWVGFQKYIYEKENYENQLYAYHIEGNKNSAGLDYAVDTEPLQEIPIEKAQSIELFPTEMLDGYVLDGAVEVYDKKVVVARFYNAELDDTLTIRIYDKEYFYTQNDDVEFNSIIYQGESSSFIYFEGDEKIIRYKFSNSDIANHEEFFDMVYSADFFQNGNIPEIKEG